MKRFKKITAVCLAGAIILSFAACSSSKKARSNTADRATLSAQHNAGDANYYEGEYEDVSYETMAPEYKSDGIQSIDAATGDGMRGTTNNASQTNTQQDQVSPDTMLIRRVTMNVETTDYNNVTNSIEAKVTELGGYVESSNESGTSKNGNLKRVSYVIRVPIDKLDELVNTVGTSTTVLSSNESTEDVTLQYSDIQSRIESLRVEQQTLNNLLAQADSLDAIITLQSRLTDVRYEIESYESRARLLKNQASYSTLTLNINEVVEETVQVETKKKSFGDEIWEGFVNTLDNLKEGGKNFVVGFISALPYLLIIAVVVLIIFLIIKAIVKKIIRKAKAKKAPSTDAKTDTDVKTTEESSDGKGSAENKDPSETK